MKSLRQRLLATSCALALSSGFAGGAFADGMEYKAPSPVPYANWSGPYIGVHVGVAREDAFCDPNGSYDYTCGYETTSSHAADTSVLAGVQAGWDFQDREFVWGAVADWSWTNLNGLNTGYEHSYVFSAKTDWLASFRGRMGLAVDRTLVYFTGGLGLGHMEATTYDTDETSTLPTTGLLYNAVRVGWVAGLGIEHKFDQHWSVNAEALYYDLGQVSQTYQYSSETYKADYSFDIWTARVGLNYHF